MAIVIHKLRALSLKKALSFVVFGGLLAGFLTTGLASAQGPQFNIFPIAYDGRQNTDLPLLDARNATLGEGWSVSQADHDAGINANPGDTIEFSVYYHNGAIDLDENVATNVIVKAFANPSLGSKALTHTISASISADNAATVTSASKGGDMTVRINGSVAQSLSLVPGSVKLFANQQSNPTTSTMPDTIFTTGVNIGNVRGCFQYSGFVNFAVKVSQDQLQGNLTIKKEVRNITKNTAFNDLEVTADPGDTVEYKIGVTATGNAVQNISVRDALDPKLSLSGNVTLDGSLISSTAFFSSGGYAIASIPSGSTATFVFRAQVAAASQFAVGTHFLNNIAYATANNQTVQDSANVKVVIQQQNIICTITYDAPTLSDGRGLRRVGDQSKANIQVSGLPANSPFNMKNQHVSGNPTFRTAQTANYLGNFSLYDTTVISTAYTTGDYNVFVELNNVNVATCRGFRIEAPIVQNLSITKTVQNDNTATGFQDQVDAQPGHSLTYRIEINPGTSNVAIDNVFVRDAMANKITFTTGTFNVNGTIVSQGQFFGTNGYSIGTINPGQTIVITYRATVASATNFTANTCEVLTNTGTVFSGTSLSNSDTASVTVCKTVQKDPGSPSPRPLN